MKSITAVEAGAALLDRELGPGWEDRIDLDTLELSSTCGCVLGQLHKSLHPHSLDYAQRVEWVHVAGTGIDSFPRELFDGRTVTCARGASAIPIAEFVLAAMLAFEKRLPETWIHEPPEHWNFAPLGWLNTRTLGLVGLGGIGVAIAERALPFGMQVRALRRRPEPSPLEGVEVVGSLEEVLPEADHLVLAAPATPRTRRARAASST